MKTVKRSFVVLGLSVVMAFAAPVDAAGLLFLSDTAAARMTDADFSAMTKAASEALDDTAVPSARSWTNPQTGSGGTLKTVQALVARSGEECKLVEHNTKAKGLTYTASSMVCKVGGNWKLVSEDFVRPPAAKK